MVISALNGKRQLRRKRLRPEWTGRQLRRKRLRPEWTEGMDGRNGQKEWTEGMDRQD